MKQIQVDTRTGDVLLVEVADETTRIADAQQQQMNYITVQYLSSIQNIQSSALGSVHTYLADDTSMSKFNAEYTFINSAAYDGSPINWYTVEAGGVAHTKDQFNQVWIDGRKQLSDAFNQWDSLIKQIKSYTQESDVPQVLAITW